MTPDGYPTAATGRHRARFEWAAVLAFLAVATMFGGLVALTTVA